MIYIYDEVKRRYKNHLKDSNNKSMMLYQCTIQDLYDNYHSLTDEQKQFLYWYEYKMPVGTGPCAMNKICWYIETQLDGYKSKLKNSSTFDYNILKVKRRCTEEHRTVLKELEQEYCECVRYYKTKPIYDKNGKNVSRKHLYTRFNQLAKEICPDDNERLNVILDITYGYKGNRQFCWDCIGELIVNRLLELESEKCIS